MDMKKLVRETAEGFPALVRRDLDATVNGWDPFENPEDSLLFTKCLEIAGGDDLDDDSYANLCDAIVDRYAEQEVQE